MKTLNAPRRKTSAIAGAMFLLAFLPAAAVASEDEDGEARLAAWGKIKRVHDDYFELRFKEGRKTKDAFVRLGEKASYLQDRMLSVDELEEGDTVWLLGRMIEREVPSRGNLPGGTDRQLQNVQAILRGIESEPKRKPPDAAKTKVAWHRGKVTRAGGSISVLVDSDTYKVVMRKDTPIMARAKAERDAVPEAGLIVVEGTPTERRPETKRRADKDKPSYEATKVILMDPRLVRGLYPLLLEL